MEGKYFRFTFQQINHMKGILSILVFITHLDALKLNKTSYYYLQKYSYILKGFFYSGYGLMKQYLTKEKII